MTSTYGAIKLHQQSWATRRGIRFDSDGYTLSLDDNLFVPLSAEARGDFGSGAGAELGEAGKRGKMQALHSSAALAYNVFEYWRARDVEAIAQACGCSGQATGMRFEAQHPTGLKGTPPHLDVEFICSSPACGGGGVGVCIESKFTEPYQDSPVKSMQAAYYTTPGLWAGMPRCEEVAQSLRNGDRRSRFDSPQLLKHILGLKGSYGLGGFRLLYLWYDFPSTEAEEHRRDLAEFVRSIEGEVQFSHLTYQELFERIRELPQADAQYLAWLQERYFAG